MKQILILMAKSGAVTLLLYYAMVLLLAASCTALISQDMLLESGVQLSEGSLLGIAISSIGFLLVLVHRDITRRIKSNEEDIRAVKADIGDVKALSYAMVALAQTLHPEKADQILARVKVELERVFHGHS